MRRILLITLTMVCLLVQAQVKFVPAMKVGQKHVYDCEANVSVAGNGKTIKSEVEYAVTEATSDGYIVTVKTTKDGEAAEGNLLEDLTQIVENTILTQQLNLQVDREGRVQHLINIDEVRQASLDALDKVYSRLVEEQPEAAQMISRDAMIKMVGDAATEEAFLRTLTATPTSPFFLTGRTLATGMKEDFVNAQEMKMQRTYTVDGHKVSSTAKSTMTSEDLKRLILNKVETLMPQQAGMIRDNIDAVLATGMLKMESEEKIDCQMGSNGWVETVATESTINMMGQKIKMTGTMKLKP
ncbi:MAG: hypothetical protein IKQ05_06285 [Prevotella sp.]|nr:hypothetical protein [Prevotella sp.]